VIDPEDDEALRDRLAGHFDDTPTGPKVVLIAAAFYVVNGGRRWRDLSPQEKARRVEAAGRLIRVGIIRGDDG
jgi:hypothetical protein